MNFLERTSGIFTELSIGVSPGVLRELSGGSPGAVRDFYRASPDIQYPSFIHSGLEGVLRGVPVKKNRRAKRPWIK